MKVVHLNTVDIRGGAAKVAYRIHHGLLKRGFDSSMIVGRKYSDEDRIYPLRKNSLFSRVTNKLINVAEEYSGLQYFFHSGISKLKNIRAFNEADLIHVHNIHGGYIKFDILKSICRIKPVILTLHDMWPFTGHCSHSYDCEKWKNECRKCPHLNTYPKVFIDTSSFLLDKKKDIYNIIENKLTITVPCKWMKEKISQSILKNMNYKHINNFADLSIFKPLNSITMRNKYNLSTNKFVICFSGGFLNTKNKGINYLFEALSIMNTDKEKLFLLTLGGKKDYSFNIQDINGLNISYKNNEAELAEIYSLSDIYVLPSLAETSSLVTIESLACGLPVVAFKIGGVPEIIDHKENGYLCEPENSKSLCEGIKYFMKLSLREQNSYREKAREKVEKLHNEATIMNHYIELYKSIINKNNN
jgi:glycosyltransferase involved in cell wall biosynthesis